MSDYFPAKLASGLQFCNRSKEQAFLTENIEKCRHTLLLGPRRYGKSSLVIHVVKNLKMPLASIDLFLAHDDKAITKRILIGISEVVSQIMPLNQKILLKLQNLFSKFRVSLGAHGFSIEISTEASGFDAVDQVFNSLESLSRLAADQDKKLIFFMDEFQDMHAAINSKSIQGAIRHVAQKTEHITFIFSGSNRRLLLGIFDDKTKPLYMLCDKLQLERMAPQHYLPHLQKFAKKRWGEILPIIIFEKIMDLTELHPYYVNLLCNELWKGKNLPQLDDVFHGWEICYAAHEDRLISELEKLTSKQQDILKALAVNPSTEPTGHTFVHASKMPTSSINQAIKTLLDKDMIYRVKEEHDSMATVRINQIRILDPLLAYALRKYA